MKLVLCPHCYNVFNLQHYLKTCQCGKTKGMYTDEERAQVSPGVISLAIGNGSLANAIAALSLNPSEKDWRSDTKDLYERHETSVICWVRPNEGPANPHTRVNKEL